MSNELQRWEAYHKQQLECEVSKLARVVDELEDCRMKLSSRDNGLQQGQEKVRRDALGAWTH
jgi:hypothetical protein